VKEAAAAFAKQLADLSKMLSASAVSDVAPAGNLGVVNSFAVTPDVQPNMSNVRPVPVPEVRPKQDNRPAHQRPEDVFLAVAGLAPRKQSSSHVLAMAKGKKKLPDCFKCGKPGHYLNDCPTQLCLCCQSPDHEYKLCPLITAPKPSINLYGMAHEELMFWEFPSSDMVRPRLDNTRLSRVTISDGNMTIEEIIAQLKWFVPDDQYQWEVRHVGENVYRVTFPSKVDLTRSQYFGAYTIPNSKVTMKFESWKRPVELAWSIDNIWVRIHDLPSEALDDFLGLWTLGSLFFKTLDIDMEFTRRTDGLRINIDCLDPSLISARLDIRIKGHFKS